MATRSIPICKECEDNLQFKRIMGELFTSNSNCYLFQEITWEVEE